MDINLMVLNVGNSRLAAGAFVAGELQQVGRAPVSDPAAMRAVVEGAWSAVAGRTGACVAGACVNPPVAGAVEQLVRDIADRSVQWVGRELELPITVLTDPPGDTGVDRIVTMAAAYEQMGKACVVVDAGTAITINCCNDNGDFLGGAIAPGASLQLWSLHTETAKLPQVSLQRPVDWIGKSTTDAMRQAVYHGARGLVRELVEQYATELGEWPEVIATGGDAELLFGGWELIHAVSPDLSLYGVALAYANHHLRHQT
jgi:type III pantothenate kinase